MLKHPRNRWLLQLGFTALLFQGAGPQQVLAEPQPVQRAPQTPVSPSPIRILVDSIHAHNKLSLGPRDYAYAYHHVYRFERAFAYLRARKVEVEEVTSGPLTPELLRGRHLVFINLVSADLPPFGRQEIDALVRYTREGGSLFFITDHSNCYYHAYKLQPLYQELDIQTRLVTACDKAPETLGPGNGWLNISRFLPHPITRGVSSIGFQTGGAVDERFAVAHTSPQAWGDKWGAVAYGEGTDQGNYGNWLQDPDEPTGSLGVVMAKNVGRGRVVVVADQNIFADPFLNYADNYRLWLGSMAWLTGRKDLADPQPYYRWRLGRVLAYEDPQKPTWANSARSGHYNLFVDLGRRISLFANADLSRGADLLLFAHAEYRLAAPALAQVVSHLRSGKNVVVLARMAPTDALKAGPAPVPSAATAFWIDQVTTVMGPPQLAAEEGAEAWVWPAAGQIVLLPPTTLLHNSHLATPEKEPDTVQNSKIRLLTDLIKGAIGHT